MFGDSDTDYPGMNRRSATTAEFGTRQDQGSKPTMFLGHDALDHLLMAVLDHDPTRCLLIVPADADEDGAMLLTARRTVHRVV